MKYLLIFSIGPVQPLIAAARKTRDLAAGSRLLSDLARAAADAIVKAGGELVFPVLDDTSNNNSCPNKVLAVVENPETIAEEASNAVKNAIADAWSGVKDKIGAIVAAGAADKQIADLPEIFWSAVRYDESQHGEARKRAEYLLAARKATRNFGPVTWGSERPKSSLDGQRESVILESAETAPAMKGLKLKAGEKLCAPGLLKRYYSPDSSAGSISTFPGTAHFAALPLLNALNGTKAIGEFIDFLRKNFPGEQFFVDAKNQTLDGRYFFSREISELAEEYFPAESDENRAQRRQILNEFREVMRRFFAAAKVEVKENGNDGKETKLEIIKSFEKEISPYYALLLADGDDMGKHLSSINDKERHQKFSLALAGFAGKAAQVVADNRGSLVYAGGDDVLAFLPLDSVLRCAFSLSHEFSSALNEFKANGETPTMSIGIVVKHYIEPLSDALEMARRAEAIAKAFPGKGAIAVTLDKRGGAPRTIRGKAENFITRIQKLMEYERAGNVSHQAAYELRDLCNNLNLNRTDAITPEMSEVLRLEARRILARKISAGDPDPSSSRKNSLIEEILPSANGTPTSTKTILDLADELVIAAMFAKCGAEIQLDRKETQERKSPNE